MSQLSSTSHDGKYKQYTDKYSTLHSDDAALQNGSLMTNALVDMSIQATPQIVKANKSNISFCPHFQSINI